MRFILRGIAIGLLAGSAFFFFPFLFRFIFFILLVSFIFRLAGRRRWRNRNFRHGYLDRHASFFDHMNGRNIISIDGRDAVQPVQNNKGNETRIPVL